MKYKKNDNVDFLDIDDENLAVYDPESGDTHYISGTGRIILSLIDGRSDLTELTNKLCEMYSADKSEIENDVAEYINELESKRVIVAYED